jgi:hypothetical protein
MARKASAPSDIAHPLTDTDRSLVTLYDVA